MGELLGIPEWLAVTLWVLSVLAVVFGYAAWKGRRQMRRLAEQRPSPDHDTFIAMLSASVDADIAEWMWETLAVYYDPMTPHPDDDLIKDVWIDDDDISMVWLPDFAKSRGLSDKNWPDWPEGWEVTVRNYARWLQLGVDAQR